MIIVVYIGMVNKTCYFILVTINVCSGGHDCMGWIGLWKTCRGSYDDGEEDI